MFEVGLQPCTPFTEQLTSFLSRKKSCTRCYPGPRPSCEGFDQPAFSHCSQAFTTDMCPHETGEVGELRVTVYRLRRPFHSRWLRFPSRNSSIVSSSLLNKKISLGLLQRVRNWTWKYTGTEHPASLECTGEWVCDDGWAPAGGEWRPSDLGKVLCRRRRFRAGARAASPAGGPQILCRQPFCFPTWGLKRP